MRRREFIALVGGAAALHPIASRIKNAAERTARRCYLDWDCLRSNSGQDQEALLRGLRKNGYSPGQSIAIEDRYFGDGPGPLGNAGEELVRLGVDVIVAMGTPAAPLQPEGLPARSQLSP